MTTTRVLAFVGAHRFAGAERALQTLLAHLPAELPITIAGPHKPVLDEIASRRPSCPRLVTGPVATKQDAGRIFGLWRDLKTARADVIHLNKVEVADLRYVELLAAISRRPVVSVVHHVERPTTLPARLLVRLLARRAKAVVAVSTRTAAELEAILGLEPGAVHVIPNALPALDVARPGPPPDKPFTVGVLSRLVRHKGVHHVIAALAEVPSARMIIGGDGPELNDLKRHVHDLGLDDRVEFLGWVDPSLVFDRCHVLVSAAYIEGHPLTLLDARRRGLPVIAVDAGGVSEVVQHDVTGVLVAKGDVVGLAAQMDRLRRDPDLRDEMSRHALERSTADGDPDAMAESYLQLYVQAVDATAVEVQPEPVTGGRR